MATTVQTPTVRFAGLYYPELLQDLIVNLRTNVPEVTDEDPHEPMVQIQRAFALVSHYDNALLDHVAQETLLPTARLRESVRGHLGLIGYRLKQQVPATCEQVLALGAPLTVATGIAEGALFATEETTADPEIVFELLEDVAIDASNVLSAAWEFDASGPTYTDRTTKLNTDADTFVPLAGAPAAGDMLYFGHDSVLWDRLDLVFTAVVAIPALANIAWEYHDAYLDDANPSSVELVGPTLRVHLNSLLGSNDRHGAVVRVRSAVTGAYEDVISSYAGGDNYADLVAYLGQSIPSVTATDYIVGVEWKELASIAMALSSDSKTLQVTFTLPETLQRSWTQEAVNGTTSFWLRARFVNAGVTLPTLDRARIDRGTQYVRVATTQGQSASDDPSGSSDGTADQTFATVRGEVIEGTVQVFVDDGAGYAEWELVDDFLASSSVDKHFTVDFDADGFAIVTFGDGTNGQIPPIGSDVRLDYRYGATDDGNVGAGSVTVNKSGLSIVAAVTNPRAAAGWKTAEGSTEEDLARVKIAGPATLRTRGRALTADDCEELAEAFTDSGGAEPVARATSVEEGFGPKTIKLLVLGAGGAALSQDVLDELDLYFNGDPVTGDTGVLVLNSELTSKNFSLLAVDVTATVKGGNLTKILQALQAFLGPLAVNSDGTFVHANGDKVYRERIVAEIFAADPGAVRNVTMTVPAADVTLATDQLPKAGTLTITIT